jgi:hypothetical protein
MKTFKGTIEEETEEDLCSSNHFILDRIAEKGSTHNLYRYCIHNIQFCF